MLYFKESHHEWFGFFVHEDDVLEVVEYSGADALRAGMVGCDGDIKLKIRMTFNSPIYQQRMDDYGNVIINLLHYNYEIDEGLPVYGNSCPWPINVKELSMEFLEIILEISND